MDTEVFAFHTNITLTEGQCHLNLYQNVECSDVCQDTKFERNQSAIVQMQANIQLFGFVCVCVCVCVFKEII